MSEHNKALVQELFAAWSAHDIERAGACIGEACNGGGQEGFRRELTAFLAAFPDMQVSLEDILAEGDKVATRITLRGTHQGVFAGIPVTGKAVVIKANHIFRLQQGQIVQRHGQMDRLELMTQLGMRLVRSEG